MQAHQLTPRNISRLAWINGFRGVAGLAREIRKSRAAVYAALSKPQSYGPTFRAIDQSIRRRDL